MKRAADFISVAFHPLLMTTGLFALLYLFSPYILLPITENYVGLFILVIFLTTFVIPLVSLTMFRMTHMIPDFHMKKKEERLIPFTFISIFYILTTVMFTVKFAINPTVSLIFYGITAIVVLTTLFTIRLKVSVHAAGAGGMIGFLMGFSIVDPIQELMLPLAVSFLMAGVIMSARLFLNAHTPREIYWGLLLGFAVSLLSVLILF